MSKLLEAASNAADIETPWTHWFMYGETGSGKTEAAATFPRPLFIVPAAEQSITTLAGRNFPYFTTIGRHQPIKNGSGGFETIISMIESEYRANPETFPFDTIVVESTTHYLELLQEEITQGNKDAMDQRKWGLLAAHLRNIQTRLRALELHVVFTALSKLEKDASDNAHGGPSLPGKTGVMLPSSCDVIAYCEPGSGKNPVYRMHFRRHSYYFARTRFKRMPPVIENFSFAKVAEFLGTSKPQQQQP